MTGLAIGLMVLVILTACSTGSDDDSASDGTADGEPNPAMAALSSATADPADTPAPTLAEPTRGPEPTAPLSDSTPTAEPVVTPEIGPDGLYTEVQVTEGGTPHLIPWRQIFSGGVPRDRIPSIDSPKFADRTTWNEYGYLENGLVIGVEVEGTRRAYPYQVIVWHEIVNDVINGKPILITYCPLCGTAIAFERSVDGQVTDFGVSGLLYNSDLLMYDRTDMSLWSQINGTAVVGDQVGKRLDYYPAEIMTWGDWRRTYPDSEVLTTETGAARDYSRDPYDNYYFDQRLLFPANRSSEIFDALPTKVDVTGIEVDGPFYGAFVDRDLRKVRYVNETVGETPVLVFADPSAGENIVVFERTVDGAILTFDMSEVGLVDRATGSRWSFGGRALDGPLAGEQLAKINTVKGFWFGWVAFHPDTELWRLPDE